MKFGGTSVGSVKSILSLKEIVEAVEIPVVAIGGINASNMSELAGSKVDGVAVVSAILSKKESKKASQELLGLIDQTIGR